MVPKDLSMLEQEIIQREFYQKKSILKKIRDNKYWGVFLSGFIFNQAVLVPVIAALVGLIAFTSMDYSMKWDFIGLKNFQKIFHDPKVIKVFWNTVMFVCMTLTIKMLLGLFVALTSSYYIKNNRVGTFFRAIWLLPKVSPGVVEALLWTWIFSPTETGVLNFILNRLYGMEPTAWLQQYPLLINIILAGVMGTAITTIILSSAIQNLDVNYFRIAKVDGASEVRILKSLILPQLKWPLTFLTLWQGLSLLTSFESIMLLTDGGPDYRSEVWSLYAFHSAFSTLDFGYGSAISLMMLPVIFTVVWIAYKAFGFKKLMNGDK
ncbi:sugar ABC transporter permease [Brevibacillus choshinensis]|uniref:carbohydrate ABC transporter permease n=1 Tax=Brevibacillus choshinensis TaxID=54911 RepID=UPI002E1C8AE4|nr:sugar ABC transporter permease [Brevibacillus choshinensis]